MYEAGASIGWVATAFGISRQGMWDILRRRTKMRDRIEALPRKPQTAIRAKRKAGLERYRAKAARITRAQINAVKARDRVCQTCGTTDAKDIDHILSVARGGQTTMKNLQLLCNPCHRAKTGAELRKGVS